MSIGANIRRRREALGMHQVELAERLNISQPMLCQIERGTKTPSLPLSVEIAAALGCSIQDIAEALDG